MSSGERRRTAISADGDSAWSGPLFLIGMPRSGTKLLRSLLNRHPRIQIPELETEFFPFWVQHWKQFGDLSDRRNFDRFVRSQHDFPYYHYRRSLGLTIDNDAWHRSCARFTPAEVFKQLVHLDTRTTPGSAIWGDKSPSYTTEIPLLLEHFPEARFIHILRDARDYCLSIYKAWRKNIPRAAVRWRDAISELRAVEASIGPERIVHVRYEDLLQEPEPVMRRLSQFLDIEFDPAMLKLTQPSENIGDARGQKKIVASNTGKYRNELPERTVQLIEAICGEQMRSFGYDVEEREPVEIAPWKMNLYRVADGLNLWRSDAREHGLAAAFKIHYSAARLAAARRRG